MMLIFSWTKNTYEYKNISFLGDIINLLYVVYGLCIYWFYISFYIDIKKQRKTFSKRYIKNGSLWVIGQKVCVTNPNKLENL